jgi:hypothetical protein
MRILFALLLTGLTAFAAQAAQQLTCLVEDRAIQQILESNPDLALETDRRLAGPQAKLIVAHHNANSPVRLDGDDWYVLVMKVIHKPSGEEAPFRLVFIGRNGEVCRQGQIPPQLIDRLLKAEPAV